MKLAVTGVGDAVNQSSPFRTASSCSHWQPRRLRARAVTRQLRTGRLSPPHAVRWHHGELPYATWPAAPPRRRRFSDSNCQLPQGSTSTAHGLGTTTRGLLFRVYQNTLGHEGHLRWSFGETGKRVGVNMHFHRNTVPSGMAFGRTTNNYRFLSFSMGF